jgi:putative tryptophan/tyrosine transport system substrate-binding protein
MKRREFITLVGGAATWSLAANAQQLSPTVTPIITLINGRPSDTGAALAAEFRKGLSEAGFIDGKDVRVEYHWLDGHNEEIPSIISDAIKRNVSAIATPASSPASVAAKAATTTIPIIFAVGEDPVALGLVASLARPGGNATGFNFFANEIDAKRLALMHELLPKAKRFAVLINPDVPASKVTSEALKRAKGDLGLELIFFNASTAAEIDAAFTAIAAQKFDALFVAPDAFFGGQGSKLATLAARDRIPATAFASDLVRAGLLMSYGTSIADVFRQVGVYSGRILQGAKPADLPVLQSTKFELLINLQTARMLGVDIPPTLLARADEVIE